MDLAEIELTRCERRVLVRASRGEVPVDAAPRLKRLKLPILVTVVTNLTIHGIGWLLPRIQQWLSSTP